MSYVYMAPLADGTAFKVGKAVAPSSRISQLFRYYDFDPDLILIVDCKTVDNAYELESILHKACMKKQKLMPFEGGTEFFACEVQNDAIAIAESVCRMNGYRTIPFIRQMEQEAIDEADLIVKSFSYKIRARRLELNLSQSQLAKLSGVGKRTVERIESEGQSSFYNMVCVLRSLDLVNLFSELEISSPLRKRATRTRNDED